jgi:hypothetical protein
MPPKGAPAPALAEREEFVSVLGAGLRAKACAAGIVPGPPSIRRLNRDEYAATIRDLLNIHINAGHNLPADGAGGEGFDNAAETLSISPIHAEKYMEAAEQALGYAFKDPPARQRFLIAEPGGDMSAEEAGTRVMERFLPRAFRRPITTAEQSKYMKLFRMASGQSGSFDEAMAMTLQAALVSPNFLFRITEPNPDPEPRLLDDYAIASRLSYFLWGSMPDDTLFDLASKGRLREPDVLAAEAQRMLKDPKTLEFTERFVEQWLGTRELGRDIKPDAKLFPGYYDAELQSAIRYEPVLFFQELLSNNESLLNLIDSKFTVLTNKLAKHYGFDSKGLSQQPKRFELPAGSHRGGLLGMTAILAVTSYPTRTSPVLRGKWILDAMLGTPPPPPPPNVPTLKTERDAAAPKTQRDRLEQHRLNPVCGSCHNKIDPLGFAMENYDIAGVWRNEEEGKAIDARGQLPDGTSFDGVDQLKQVLLARKTLFFHNLTSKMLGYALGRGLTAEDSCVVDRIVEQLIKQNYSANTLIREIVLSPSFRWQPGTTPNLPVPGTEPRHSEAQ